MNVVLIPTWRRPEMLWHCLQNIKRAHGANKHLYLFRLDVGYDKETLQVIDEFPLNKLVSYAKNTPYGITKQSHNLLEGYRMACERTDDLVYLIEEDIFVAQDFFTWHEAVMAQWIPGTLFCSIAAANHNRTLNVTGSDREYYSTTLDYCSWGVCWHHQALRGYVLKHAAKPYYVNPRGYMIDHFPKSRIGLAYVEQDGLIRRIQEDLGMDRPIVYPFQPRAYHAGVYGYNRGGGITGSLQDRIKWVAKVCYDDDQVRLHAKRPEWYEDSRPIPLNRIHSVGPEGMAHAVHRSIDLITNPSKL
jgi:hypothetical protein